MIDFFNTWVKGIVVAVIISTIIEMILPNGNIKKYVRCVIGVYIVIVIVNPVITLLTGEKISIKQQEEIFETRGAKIPTLNTKQYIEKVYVGKMKNEIIEDLQDKGYKVESIDLIVNSNNENYGKIEKVKIIIHKQQKDISNIKSVEISIKEKEKTDVKQLTEEEINSLKDYLNSNYGVDLKNISINNT